MARRRPPRRRSRGVTTAASVATVAALVVGMIAVPVAAQQEDVDGRYRGFGDPGGVWNIVPPGQDGVLSADEAAAARAGSPPPHVQDQLGPYEALVFDGATPGFTGADLDTYFKDASFGVAPDDVGRVYAPGGRDDVEVVRDTRAGVPHIFGETRDGTMFAQGYTAAEDRLFLMDVLRRVGRAELSAWLGASEANLEQDAAQMAAAPYAESDLTAQVEALRTSTDATERQVHADALAYLDGVNTYVAEALADPDKLPAEYPALQRTPEEFVPEDLVAIASLVGGIFGKGGGREVANACGLAELTATTGDAAAARAVFDDLKFADDPEAPVTAPAGRFPYLDDLGPVDPAAVPELDCASLRALEAPGIEEAIAENPELALHPVRQVVPDPPLDDPTDTAVVEIPGLGRLDLTDRGLSNALLVGRDHTDTGAPLAVFGPQTGYFMPQLLVEKDVHGPGIDARGVAFAGTDLYVQLGRGADFAWSATSAGADIVDEVVLELCDPDGGPATEDSMGYVHDGACTTITAVQEVLLAQPSAAGAPPEQVVINKYFEQAPDYGFVTARGRTVDGTPVAIATARSTYHEELRSARGFAQINDPAVMADGVDAFRRVMGEGVDYTFNWFYADAEDIAYQMSCRCPRRAAGVDPYLPTWGRGAHDWQGELDLADKPWSVNPAQGWLVSWNNKQADGFRSSDSQVGFGPIHRADLLTRRIESEIAVGPVTVGEAVDVMALAGTTDLRGQELTPLLAAVMEGRTPDDVTPRAAAMLDRLTAWHADDLGHRRDHDDDGAYEHATAIAIMDAWWGGLDEHPDAKLFDAVFEPQSGGAREALGLRVHDAPQNHLGSAFQDSLYPHVHKDLRQVLGQAVDGPFSRTYCGGGDLDACAATLWRSLDAAGAALEDEFGSPEVDDWRRTRSDDAIRHTAVGVTEVPETHWQNRPTFQQVVDLSPPTSRVAGDTRRGTAVAASRGRFDDGEASAVVLARDDAFPDALGGTPFAVAHDAPLLLTPPDALAPEVRSEIERVAPRGATVYLLGGAAALRPAVEQAVREAGYRPERIEGPTRYDTALRIAEHLGDPATLLVTTGDDFPDGLTAGTAAAVAGGAVLLTPSERRWPALDRYLAGRDGASVTTVGGPAARPYDEYPGIVGGGRYETATLVAREWFADPYAVGVARGDAFADALTGGVHAAFAGGPLTLTAPDRLPRATADYLREHRRTVHRVYLYGGPVAISESVRAAVADTVG